MSLESYGWLVLFLAILKTPICSCRPRIVTMASRKTSSTLKEDPRLLRIRENQRRSRARRREYLEDLESRWEKCQELGVQANVELQRAARKVIEENSLLRKLLAELGLGAQEVDERLRVLRGTTAIDGEGINVGTGDGGFCGGLVPGKKLNCVGQEMVNSGKPFEPFQTPLEFIEKSDRPILSSEPTEIDPIDLSQMNIDLPPAEVDVSSPFGERAPAFYMSQLEPILDYDNIFDISDFLESLDSPLSPTETNPAPNQEALPSSCLDTVTLDPSTPSTSTPVLPRENSAVCEPTLKHTTPCMEAYALLKALNAQQQEHKDMLEIVLELWGGFCDPESGEDTEVKGCRVNNEVLQKVIDGMK